MSHHSGAPSRHAKLPPVIHVLVLATIAVCFLSGVAIWRGTVLREAANEAPAWLRTAIKIHGLANPAMIFLTGYIACRHIPAAFHQRANSVSGMSLAAVLGLLIVSGVWISYGSESSGEIAAKCHRTLGLLLPIVTGLHIVAARKWIREIESAAPSEQIESRRAHRTHESPSNG